MALQRKSWVTNERTKERKKEKADTSSKDNQAPTSIKVLINSTQNENNPQTQNWAEEKDTHPDTLYPITIPG